MERGSRGTSRGRARLLKHAGVAAAALLVIGAVVLAALLGRTGDYRTETMRPGSRTCVVSGSRAALLPSGPSALLFGGKMVSLPESGARRVRHWIHRFSDPRYRGRIQRYLARAHVRSPEILPVLRQVGVPEEVLYLMLIESGGNPGAVSSARAVGMWQFMSYTARDMGLTVGPYFDARRQPGASTRAAARYLSELHDEFDSWWLAMAAYNAGPHRVRRALRRAPEADYFELARRKLLPPSTREYVPKTLAALLIGRDPGRWGFDPALVPRERQRFDRMAVASGTTWEALAEATGVPEGWLRRVNPEYPRDLVAAPGRPRVRVPAGRAGAAGMRLAAIPEDERLGMMRHTVRRGETLGEIASRYGIPVDRVMAINRQVDPRRLAVGDQLRIPAGR